MVRSFALQQSFLLLATVSAAAFQTGLELKIEMAHAVDVPTRMGFNRKVHPLRSSSRWETRIPNHPTELMGEEDA